MIVNTYDNALFLKRTDIGQTSLADSELRYLYEGSKIISDRFEDMDFDYWSYWKVYVMEPPKRNPRKLNETNKLQFVEFSKVQALWRWSL